MIASGSGNGPLSKKELIGLTAATMALTALTIDMMLAALSDISLEFGLSNENDRQLVVIGYMFGAGVATLVYGPLADRFGRRPVFLWAMAGFLASTVLCVVASGFGVFIAGRFLQGVFSSAGRVVMIALVRDLYRGREMASIMSMALTVGMISPIIAPTLGQLVLLFSPWRTVFIVLFIAGAGLMAWVWARMPESLTPDQRRRLSLHAIFGSLRAFTDNRVSFGYTIAAVSVNAALIAYISSAQQVFEEAYDLGPLFPMALACGAVSVAVAALLNARLVHRFGMRRLSHAALLAFIVINAFTAALLATVGLTIIPYLLLVFLAFFSMGLINANFGAIVMEPMGALAGSASAAFAFATTAISAVIGGIAAQTYNGSPTPIVACFALLGLLGLGAVLITERGRLFEEQPA